MGASIFITRDEGDSPPVMLSACTSACAENTSSAPPRTEGVSVLRAGAQ